MSCGAVAGALTASRLEHRIGRSHMLFLGYLGPLLIVPVVLTPPPEVLYVLVFIFGLADAWAVIAMQAYMAEWTADEMRGRVSAISGLAISASNELGEMQSGIAASLLGATGAVVFGGAGAIIVTVLWAIMFPELRRARTFAPQYRQREPQS